MGLISRVSSRTYRPGGDLNLYYIMAYVKSKEPYTLPFSTKSFKYIFPTSRFQNNPRAHHILSDDTFSCKIGADGEINYKLFQQKTNPIPKIFLKFWPSNVPKKVMIVEEISTDFSKSSVTHLSRNIDFRGILVTHELTKYDLKKQKVAKSFLCKSGYSGITGYSLRQFGFWRWDNNELLANEGLKYQCTKFEAENPIPTKTISVNSRSHSEKKPILTIKAEKNSST